MLLNGKDKSHNYVRPFPTLEKNVVDDHKAIVNAVDIYMGQNGILWVLDIGVVNTLEEKPKKECEAKVLGIDYGNGRVSINNILSTFKTTWVSFIFYRI
jgi:hypothetical protein